MGRIRIRYKTTKNEYSRCRALGIPGRGYRVVPRKYDIALVLLRRFINREHQEGLDSTDANEGSSDKDSSTGELFLDFIGVGLRVGMEGFHLVLALRPTLHFVFFILKG